MTALEQVEVNTTFTETSFDDFVQMGMQLREKADHLAWDLGDLAAEVSIKMDKIGFNEFAKAIGVKVSTLKRYRDVSRKYPDKAIRAEFRILSWSHFREVAGKDNRMELLLRACDENWSCEKLAVMAKGDPEVIIDDGYIVPPKPEMRLCLKCRKWYIGSQVDQCLGRGNCD